MLPPPAARVPAPPLPVPLLHPLLVLQHPSLPGPLLHPLLVLQHHPLPPLQLPPPLLLCRCSCQPRPPYLGLVGRGCLGLSRPTLRRGGCRGRVAASRGLGLHGRPGSPGRLAGCGLCVAGVWAEETGVNSPSVPGPAGVAGVPPPPPPRRHARRRRVAHPSRGGPPPPVAQGAGVAARGAQGPSGVGRVEPLLTRGGVFVGREAAATRPRQGLGSTRPRRGLAAEAGFSPILVRRRRLQLIPPRPPHSAPARPGMGGPAG
jgi:hypothetical protein